MSGKALQERRIYWSTLCYFVNKIIEYDITNEELARFKKSNYNSNYRQNTLHINLDGDKYRTLERSSFFYKVWTEM